MSDPSVYVVFWPQFLAGQLWQAAQSPHSFSLQASKAGVVKDLRCNIQPEIITDIILRSVYS